ncbi:hypothetical protein JTB14_009308 [Gonioctena quinquepunctata]|nr:hypothetical protein JTB14_009308 [Gonioctena quinquepunctata]
MIGRLSQGDEKYMMVGCTFVAVEWIFPCDSEKIQDLVQNYSARGGRTMEKFTENRPGETWMQKFLGMNENLLSARFSKSIRQSRILLTNILHNLPVSSTAVSLEAFVNRDESN